MKALRHSLQVVFRLLLAVLMAVVMPMAHLDWGEPYPGEGQKSFGMLLTFFMVGVSTALVFFIAGTVLQFLLQRRSPMTSLILDIGFGTFLIAVLIYGGVNAHYLN